MTAPRTPTTFCLLGLSAAMTLFGGCLSSSPTPNRDNVVPASGGPGISTAAAARPGPSATIVSQAQPGFSGRTVSGVVSISGSAPPPGSSLFLALVKSADDQQPRPCIDAARNPINNVGQFYAQVACAPQQGDQLLYVLVIGPEGERNWHRGVAPMPADLANVHLDVQ